MTDQNEEPTPVLTPFEKATPAPPPAPPAPPSVPKHKDWSHHKWKDWSSPEGRDWTDKQRNGAAGVGIAGALQVGQGVTGAAKGLSDAAAKVIDTAFNPSASGINEMQTAVDAPATAVDGLGNGLVQGAQGLGEVLDANSKLDAANNTQFDFEKQFETAFKGALTSHGAADLSSMTGDQTVGFSEDFSKEAVKIYNDLRMQYKDNPEAIKYLEQVYKDYMDKVSDKQRSLSDARETEAASMRAQETGDEAKDASEKEGNVVHNLQTAYEKQKDMDKSGNAVWNAFKQYAEWDGSGVVSREHTDPTTGAVVRVIDSNAIWDGEHTMLDPNFDPSKAKINYSALSAEEIKKMKDFFADHDLGVALGDTTITQTEDVGRRDQFRRESIVTQSSEHNKAQTLKNMQDSGLKVTDKDLPQLMAINNRVCTNYLPPDMSDEEIVSFMSRGGIYSVDPADREILAHIAEGMTQAREKDPNHYKKLAEAAQNIRNGVALKPGEKELQEDEIIYQNLLVKNLMLSQAFEGDVVSTHGPVDEYGMTFSGKHGTYAQLMQNDPSGATVNLARQDVMGLVNELNQDLIDMTHLTDAGRSDYLRTHHSDSSAITQRYGDDLVDPNLRNYGVTGLGRDTTAIPKTSYLGRMADIVRRYNNIATSVFHQPGIQMDLSNVFPQISPASRNAIATIEAINNTTQSQDSLHGHIAKMMRNDANGNPTNDRLFDITMVATAGDGSMPPDMYPRGSVQYNERMQATRNMISNLDAILDDPASFGFANGDGRLEYMDAYRTQLRYNLFTYEVTPRIMDDINNGTFALPNTGPRNRLWNLAFQNMGINALRPLLNLATGSMTGGDSDIFSDRMNSMRTLRNNASMRSRNQLIFDLINQYMSI